jgi:hypothetical protein
MGIVTDGLVLHYSAALATGSGPGINSPLTDPIQDLTAGNHDGDLQNFAGTEASGYGGAGTQGDPYRLSFDSTNDKVYVTDFQDAGGPQTAATIEFWVKAHDFTQYNAYWGRASQSRNIVVIRSLITAGTLQFALQNADNTSWTIASGQAIGTGAFYHVLCRFDRTASTAEGFVNNVSGGSSSDISAWNGPTQQLAYIGHNYANSNIAVFRIYNRSLTNGEVQQNYEAGYLPEAGVPDRSSLIAFGIA